MLNYLKNKRIKKYGFCEIDFKDSYSYLIHNEEFVSIHDKEFLSKHGEFTSSNMPQDILKIG